MSNDHTTPRIYIRVLLTLAMLLSLQGCAPMTKHAYDGYIQTSSYKTTSSLKTLGKKSAGVILLPLAVTGDILFQPIYILGILLLLPSAGGLKC